MNLTALWIESDWMKALGWTFVHSLWQIAVIGLILYIILRLIPGHSAHTRYTFSTLALWMVVIMAISTFIIMLPESRPVAGVSGDVFLITTAESLSLTERISSWLELRIPMMLTLWLGGVSILMIRLAISLGWVRHLRAEAMPDDLLQNTLDQIITRLRLNLRPRATTSGLVSSPVTIGHLKPLILFPVAIINQLTPQQVEAILTHELAHIVRRDYLSNLIQSFIETLFYYHPVTWWISRMVRAERENRADDLAISWCGNHLEYAKALVAVEEMQLHSPSSLALGFASGKGAMLTRIQRILHIPNKNHNQMEKTVLLSLGSLCFLAFTFTSHAPAETASGKRELIPAFWSVPEALSDSIPAKGTYRIHKKTDDQDISIEVEDGDIRHLKIDGKDIQPSEFDAYGAVVDDLFSSIQTAPGTPFMGEFRFVMPPMPGTPMSPDMMREFELTVPGTPMMPISPDMMREFEFMMPPIPPMPPMPEMDFDQMFEGQDFKWIQDGSNISLWNGDGVNRLKIITDTMPTGRTKIIILNNGDTTFMSSDHFSWSGDAPKGFHFDTNKFRGEDWQKHQEAWKEQAEQWRRQSREHQEQRRQQQQEWRELYRHQSEDYRDLQERLREELRGKEWKEAHGKALEELRRSEGSTGAYALRAPRVSLSDQLVRDGLIERGDEVEVLLTPEKLKIDGKKMPDDVHQKYLKIYEQQQGIQLSGKSRVEFTTKSKRRM